MTLIMPKNDEPLKLSIELVPSSSWCNNFRNCISPKQWDKIRKKAYADANYKCGICGTEGKLSCHEIWEYDDINHIQRLKGFIALCDMCHSIKHIGRSGILAKEGKLDYDALVEDFMKINNCDLKKFFDHRKMAFKKWEERSDHEWTLDFGEHQDIVNKKTKS